MRVSHLIGGVGFADLAHGEADVDQHPIARDGRLILQQAQIHFAAHTDDVNDRLMRVLRINLDDFSGYC